MTVSSVVDAKSRVDEQTARVRRPLWVHALALAVVLFALLPLIGTDAVYSADEGAAMLQVGVLDRTGGFSEPNPFPVVDPDGDSFGVHLSKQIDDGTFGHLTRRPIYPLALFVVNQLGLGLAGAIGLSVLGTVAAASAAGRLVRHWNPRLDAVVLWAAGLLSPLVFNSYWVIAHAVGAGFVGWAVVKMFGDPDEGPSVVDLALGGGLLTLGALFRSEVLLFAIAFAIALLVVDLGISRRVPIRAAVAGAATVGAIVVNKWLASAVVGTVVGAVSGTSSASSVAWLPGRIGAFEKTVLRVSPSGWQVFDLLLVLAVGLAALSVVSNKENPKAETFTKLAFVAAGLTFARFLVDPTTVVRGLLMAFPILPVGVLALRAKHVRRPEGVVVLATSALFCAAVLFNQHHQGGSAEFGGRYFAVMLPVLVPLLIVALADVGAQAPDAARTGWRIGVGVMAVLTVGMGLLGLEASKDRSAAMIAGQRLAIDQVVAETGEPAVVVSTVNPVSRWSWELYAEGRWLLVAEQDLAETAEKLGDAGVDRFVVVGWQMAEEGHDRVASYGRTNLIEPIEDYPFTVSIYAAK